jgi:hypothetical protein
MAPFAEQTLARWRAAPPRVRRVAVAAAAVLAAWGLALAVANRPAARAQLRASIREALGRRLPGAEIGDDVSVDALLRVSFGPLTVRGEGKAPPLLRADRVRVRARLWSLLGGRVEPASVRFYGVRLTPGERLGELRAFADRLRPRPDPEAKPQATEGGRGAARDWPAIHVRSAVIALRHDGADVELGPFDASVLRRRSRGSDDLEIAASFRKGGRARAELHRGGDGYALRASLLELPPEALPAPFAEASVRWSDGTLSGDLSLSGQGGGPAKGRMRARLDRAWFVGERLAPEPVGPVTVDLDGALEVEPAGRRVVMRDGNLRILGAVDAALDAEARLGPGYPFSFSVVAPSVDFGVLADALPAALRPPPEAPAPSGPLSFRLSVSGPLREPAAWAVEADLDLAKLREAARRLPPVALRSPFTWRPEIEGGEQQPIRVGPESPGFVPLSALPEHVVRAVTTSEDAGFFAHPGFDFQELRNAFAQGTEAGHVVRGASTITQQLAKNLYLSREKTLSRKAREAMVAIALEATVPKARLLEIYLNIAEWGPGIWGIGPAAQHYFGKPAGELTVREAAFLASIIPNPVRFHGYYTRGELDEAWTERLRVLLLHMAEAGVLSEEQLLEALDAPLRFASRTASLDGAGREETTSGGLPLAEPALEALPADGHGPGGDDHQDDAGDRPVE